MKKGIISLGLFALAACVFMSGAPSADAAGDTPFFDSPDGYFWLEATSPAEADHGCLTCAHQSAAKAASVKVDAVGPGAKVVDKATTHLENCIGVGNAVDTHGTLEAGEVFVSGRGWVSSKHAYSMDGASANTYCAMCHGPGNGRPGMTYKFVTDDPTKAKTVKKNKPGMACIGCHCSHGIAAGFGTRFTNYVPGADTGLAASFIPRHIEDGKAANKQCLWCHGSYHEFAVDLHTNMVKSGSLRCVDCHMAVFNDLASGTHERYHNMKVLANGTDSCSNNGACHTSWKNKDMVAKVAKLLGAHGSKNNEHPLE